MNEPQTASELMMQSQMPKEPMCVLPNATVQQFLLDLVEQSNFPGKMVEFVSSIKVLIKEAKVG